MGKYLAWAKAGLKNTMAYRSDFFLWGFNELLDTVVFLFIWSMIYGDRNNIGGFSLSETITYLIGVGLIADISASQLTERIERDVQEGRLSAFLIKPMDYFFTRFFGSFANKPLNVSIRILVYFVVALFFRDKIILDVDAGRIFLTLLSVALAVIINAVIDFSVGCASFWTITSSGFGGIARTIKSIFSGGYAPIAFFPKLFQNISLFLPFIYIRYFSMLIYLKKVTIAEAIGGIGIQILWIVVIYLLARALWNKGIKKYEGVGI